MQKIGGKGIFWRDGRLSWPFVILVAYFALALFALDLAWRLFKMPIDELLMYASAVFVVSFALLLLAFRMFRAKAKTP
jgi:hypothetical protein